jgi:hypothetical protein
MIAGIKNEDEICTSSLSSSTIPLTSGIEEAPQLLLSVAIFLTYILTRRKPLYFLPQNQGFLQPVWAIAASQKVILECAIELC